MLSIIRYCFDRMACDESGAELPEWVINVAILAAVGAVLFPIVSGQLTGAFTTVLSNVPGVGGT